MPLAVARPMHDRIATVLARKGRAVECTMVYTTVYDAVAHMNAERIGALVVTDGERVVGILTERDVLARVLTRELDPHATPVGEVMTGDPITIAATATVAEALHLLRAHRCRHLPVVDRTGLCGLISRGDLYNYIRAA